MSNASAGSAGEKFVCALKSDPDLIPIFLFDDVGKMDLVRMNKKLSYDVHRSDGITCESSEIGCPDDVSSQLYRLRQALSLPDGQILVAAARTTKEES